MTTSPIARCEHCGSELVVGMSHRYLMRCTNLYECGRYCYATAP
jgi:hypothetical protein